MLVFRAGEGKPRAVPLALVTHVERFDAAKIEATGSSKAVQYCGTLMPLVPFDAHMQLNDDSSQPVLVFSPGGRMTGLMVDHIVGIVEESIDLLIVPENKPGFIGSAMIGGETTDIINVRHFLAAAPEKKTGKKILLVDGSSFFHNTVSPLLGAAGHQVVSARNGDEAMALCSAGETFDVIISDIDLPVMNGFTFAQKIKSGDSRWRHVPLLALASQATAQDLDRGKAAGFNDYIAKFDREALLQSIARIG